MANMEHIEQLLRGVKSWNSWRNESGGIRPDLSGANLSEADLVGANLSATKLIGTDLVGARLSEVDLRHASLLNARLSEADLKGANLSEANLSGASLREALLNHTSLVRADLVRADLARADLSGADLREANLIETSLREARLIGSNLSEARISETDLSEADLREATLWGTHIAKVNLCATKGLLSIRHRGPSHVELFSVRLPQDGSALHFLRGAGVPDEWIDDYRARMMHPIQYHSCFISYSSQDEIVAKRLYNDLQGEGVRCWFAPEDMKIGNVIRQRIDEAIHLQEKLLLILSEHSIASSWVRDEVEAAYEKEKRQKREVLFPIQLDNTVMQASQAWAATLRRTRHIGDFTAWTNPPAYQIAFARLLRDLKRTGA